MSHGERRGAPPGKAWDGFISGMFRPANDTVRRDASPRECSGAFHHGLPEVECGWSPPPAKFRRNGTFMAFHWNRVPGRVRRRLRCAARAARRVDGRIAKRYLAGNPRPKLHLGCGGHVLKGWLNSDMSPESTDVLGLDAASSFPFSADTFAYVYSEHVIGSLSLEGAAVMLGECFRVLAPGGRLRIVTPDLAFLTDLYGRNLSEMQKRYVEWFSAETGSPRGEIGFVVNGYMRAWGLQVVYDARMLRDALATAGFSDVTSRGLNESGHAALRDLANERRLPEGLLRLESLTLEGSKANGTSRDDEVRGSGGRRAVAGRCAVADIRGRGGAAAADGHAVSARGRRWSERLARCRRRLRRCASRVVRPTERRIVESYLAETREPKLHLGCHEEFFDGWLNADLAPRLAEVMRVDAERPLPFSDDTFVYVYSEYMLSSVAFRKVPAMLRECFRVLVPGGKLRISTIDMAFLAGLCGAERSPLQQRYMRWASDRRLMRCRHGVCRAWRRRRGARAADGPPPVDPGVFFNHHLHTDSERFVYDAPVLGRMLEGAGFSNVVRCGMNRSADSALCGLANEKRMPDGFLEMECLTLEGTKPAEYGVTEYTGR